jgi:alpha-aminoadipate carrier protein LysW
MVNCPECDAEIDIEADDVDEGDVVSCDECGADLRVLSTEPLELAVADEEEEEEEEEDDEFFEDEEEEETEDDWK